MTPVGDLKPHPANPRIHSDESVAHEVTLIEHYGWTVPILIDEDKMILAGHKRRLAAIEMGLTEVPTIERPGLSESDKLGYVIADNQATFNSPWNYPALGLSIGQLDTVGFELPLLGFPSDQLMIFRGTPRDGELVDDPSGEWVGMPAFDHQDKTAFRSITIHFKDAAAVEQFSRAINQKIPEKVRWMWYPVTEVERFADKAYVDEQS